MKTYRQFITEGVNEYEVTYKTDGGSHEMMTVVKGENEEEAKANFKRQKPHTSIVKVKKRGLLHKIMNIGRKDDNRKKGVYKTDHSYRTGDDIDPDTVPVFKSSLHKD